MVALPPHTEPPATPPAASPSARGPAARLRQATRADIPGIWRVRYAVRENTLRPGVISDEDCRREIEDTGRGWVVVETEPDGECIVAFAIGNAREGHVWALFVDPRAEGRGHGRALHDAMVAWLWTQGAEQLWLSTGIGTRAQGFYEHLGWRAAGLTPKGEMRYELALADAPAGLRLARADDAATIAALGLQVFLDTYASGGVRPALADEAQTLFATAAVAAALARPGTEFVLAEAWGHLRGFAQLRHGAPSPAGGGPAAELERLYVQPRHAARGLGTALLRAAEQRAAAAGARQLWLTAWVGNARARAFYAARGYADAAGTTYSFGGVDYDNRVFVREVSPAAPGA